MATFQRIARRPTITLLRNGLSFFSQPAAAAPRSSDRPIGCPAPLSPRVLDLPAKPHAALEKCDPSPALSDLALDLPALLGRLVVIEEPPAPAAPPAKEARNDVMNRRKRMKKHKRKKFLRDYYIDIRKLAANRKAKKERALQESFELQRLRTEGWSAQQHVEHELNLARRGGFYIDILKSRGGLTDDK